jgi:sugar diacid utilization regulator
MNACHVLSVTLAFPHRQKRGKVCGSSQDQTGGPEVSIRIPPLKGRLRELTLSLAKEPSVVADRIYEILKANDAGYAELPPVVRQDVKEFLQFSTQLWFKSLLEGSPLTEAEMQVIADSSRRRVHQGLALTSMLRAARLGPRELWRTLLEKVGDDRIARDELLQLFSFYLLDYFDDLSQRMAAAYLDEQFQRTRWRDALRYELLSVIFGFHDDEVAFDRATAALGLDGSVPRVCIAFDVTMPDVLPSHVEGELDRLVLGIARALGVTPDALVRAVHRDRMVVWVPVIRGDSTLAVDNFMQRQAASVVNAIANVHRVGIGLMNHGARGWSASLDEAFKALDGGLRLTPSRPVVSFSEMVLNEGVMRSSASLRYLDSIIERLSHEPDLLSTLGAFFEAGQHRKNASKTLGIHPNTLNYRLGRIEEILGASLDDASWLARLHVALTLRAATERNFSRLPPGS